MSIKTFLAGVGSALLAVAGILLGLFIGRGKGGALRITQADIDRNNSRIRQGFDDSQRNNQRLGVLNDRERDSVRAERERLKREREDQQRGKSSISDTRRTVSEIIRDANRDQGENENGEDIE